MTGAETEAISVKVGRSDVPVNCWTVDSIDQIGRHTSVDCFVRYNTEL